VVADVAAARRRADAAIDRGETACAGDDEGDDCDHARWPVLLTLANGSVLIAYEQNGRTFVRAI
jgi:hypothetical protein